MVPLAGADKRAQRLDHAPQLRRADLELADMSESKRSDICAVAMLVAPKFEEVRNLVEGESKVAGAANKAQPLHVGHFVVAVAAGGATDGRQQAGRFIIADHLGGYARRLSGAPYIHGDFVLDLKRA